MFQGTTPTYLLTVPGFDLEACTVFVTLEGGQRQFVLTGSRLTVAYDSENDQSTIAFGFSQEETFRLPQGSLSVEVRFIDEENQAYVTDRASISVEPVLLRKVIRFEEADDGE